MANPKKRAPGQRSARTFRDLRDRVTDGVRQAAAVDARPEARDVGKLAGLTVWVSGEAVVVGGLAFAKREAVDICTMVRAGTTRARLAEQFRCSVEHIRALVLLDERRKGEAA